jgi:membrane-bound metal-dependent hydrolase YbcI (DUF457 family)
MKKSTRKKLMDVSEKHHECGHILFGLIAAGITKTIYTQVPIIKLLPLAILMSLLPDIDHILYFFWYGKSAEYSKKIKKILKKKGLRAAIEMCKKEHKKQTGIYSHNLLLAILLGLISFIKLTGQKNPYTSVLLLSWAFHYVYDVLEDLLFFGKLNPNWFLKFNEKSRHPKR